MHVFKVTILLHFIYHKCLHSLFPLDRFFSFSTTLLISLSMTFVSVGIFQTGPASLNAIKQGLVYLPYDAPFVFAEVNADRVYWQCERKYGDWDMKKISTTTSSIGKSISTKAVGSSFRHDITDQYKYSECKRLLYSVFVHPLP